MKKLALSIVVVCFVFVWASFWYMENKVFCTISPNTITVTLDIQNNDKCMDYITVLTQAINKEYKNVLAIQKLIEQNYDVDFWFEIRELKRTQIKKMLIIKKQIQDSMVEFEDNLFDKTKEYMIYSVLPYQTKYKRLLKPLEKLEEGTYLSLNVRNKITLLQEQLEIIDIISWAEDYDTLMNSFNRYIYLKKQIEWK